MTPAAQEARAERPLAVEAAGGVSMSGASPALTYDYQCVGWADSRQRGTCPVLTVYGLCQFCTRTLERKSGKVA